MTRDAVRKISGGTVYENRWMRVREDRVQFSDGSRGIYGVVGKADFALIVPVHADGRYRLVQQFRYPVGGRYWEFPQGAWETRPDSDAGTLARAELEEETGFRAGTLSKIGYLFEAYGFADHGFHVFTASDLTAGCTRRDREEQDMVTAAFTLDDIRRMVADGAIRDAPTLAALGLLALRGLLPAGPA